MNEIGLKFSKQSPEAINSEIIISLDCSPEEGYLMKFMVGLDGIWDTLKDFSYDNNVLWKPAKPGNYIIMGQIKRKNSERTFDMVSRCDYSISEIREPIIKDININRNTLKPGDKLQLEVIPVKEDILYRFWIRRNDDWEIIKNYSADNILTWSTKEPGKGEVLVECKNSESQFSFEDFRHVEFEVLELKSLKITDFRCLTPDIILGNELIFEVDASYDDKRMVLYKFIKLDGKGNAICIQEYSNRRVVCFNESMPGEYKLLCLAKDMYSCKEYDCRALINYKVKPYKDIEIMSFNSDVSSPQMAGNTIILKAVVTGGSNLRYRFIIDGNYGEDSSYIKSNTYVWNTVKKGNYKIELWVKDISYAGNYEQKAAMNFTIDEDSKDSVKIEEVITDKNDMLLTNETVNLRVISRGGTELRYSFLVKKDGKDSEKIQYGSCNYINFTPEAPGDYEIEILVKDKYSRRDFDAHTYAYFHVYSYMPANIDYILIPPRDNFLVGNNVDITIITRNTTESLIKYILKINGHKAEETEYSFYKTYRFLPKCKGKYEIEVYAKNKKSPNEFDSRKDISIKVINQLPITGTKLRCDTLNFIINKPLMFSAIVEAGGDAYFEFYLMEKDEWRLVQNFSKKNYYGFIPFSKGIYKVLVLTKKAYSRLSYEDYDIFEFLVE